MCRRNLHEPPQRQTTAPSTPRRAQMNAPLSKSLLAGLLAPAVLLAACASASDRHSHEHRHSAMGDPQAMCEMHKKMMAGMTPEQRQAMMNEHMKTMTPEMRE